LRTTIRQNLFDLPLQSVEGPSKTREEPAMTTRTWIGGGNNKASNPRDWSPTGTPQPGDTLTMTPNATINIRGNDLAGDTLNLTDNDTVNLSKGAHAVVDAGYSPPTSVSDVFAFNISGTDTLTLGLSANDSVVNIAANSKWIGGFDLSLGVRLTVNGDAHASFENQTSSVNRSFATINADVTGTGQFSVTFGSVEFMKSVSAGQTVKDVIGGVQIDHPSEFYGSVVLNSALNVIDLMGLAKADSYTFKNDMLSIYSAGKVIDTLRLVDNVNAAMSPLEVGKTGSTVVVGFVPSGTPLPIHS
jgi:hypothetical protein